MKVYLCHTDSCCPAVEITDSGVRIGEAENTCTLTKEQWNILVEKITSGELGKL